MANPETAADCAAVLIHQASFLLDQQLRSLEEGLVKSGDMPERVRHARRQEIRDQFLGAASGEDERFFSEHNMVRLPSGRVVSKDELNKDQ